MEGIEGEATTATADMGRVTGVEGPLLDTMDDDDDDDNKVENDCGPPLVVSAYPPPTGRLVTIPLPPPRVAIKGW